MIRFAALAVLGQLAPLPAAAADYGQAFVDAFAAACVPERLSYAGTRSTAVKLGWMPADRSAHPELASMMAKMDEAAAEAAAEMQGTFEHQVYARPIAGEPHYLIVSRSSFVVDFGGAQAGAADRWTYVGCYLYNFDAAAPIDPAPLSALTGQPIAHALDEDGVVSYVWGPPCPMPRTGDSYLTFIAEDSPQVTRTGFSGLMVKFETSEPDPGEVVPETYCTAGVRAAED